MLNILEDYLIASDISYGRIDGSIQGTNRQKAIDSFQAPNSDMTVMLLSTKAGGVGITLTAADTCIIYDSDWNPQVGRWRLPVPLLVGACLPRKIGYEGSSAPMTLRHFRVQACAHCGSFRCTS